MQVVEDADQFVKGNEGVDSRKEGRLTSYSLSTTILSSI